MAGISTSRIHNFQHAASFWSEMDLSFLIDPQWDLRELRCYRPWDKKFRPILFNPSQGSSLRCFDFPFVPWKMQRLQPVFTRHNRYHKANLFQRPVLSCSLDLRTNSGIHYSLFSWFRGKNQSKPEASSWNQIHSHLPLQRDQQTAHNLLTSPELLPCL